MVAFLLDIAWVDRLDSALGFDAIDLRSEGMRDTRGIRSLQENEAAQVERNLAHGALEVGELRRAWKHLHQVLTRLSKHLVDQRNQALFVPTSLEFSGLCNVLMQGFDELWTVLQRAKAVSEDLGDRRSRALINLHLGRLHYLGNRISEAMEAFSEGKRQAEELGDEDIRIEVAEFVGMYYFIQGRFREARPHFEEAARSVEAGILRRLFHPWAPVWLASCYSYLAQFQDAIGTADYYRRMALARSDHNLACVFQAVLGTILSLVNKSEEAHFHLSRALEKSKQTQNVFASLYVKAGLAHQCFREGRLAEAREWFLQSRAEGHSSGIILEYTSGVILEIFFELARRGTEPTLRFDSQRELDRILRQPDIHLRGVALRLAAMEGTERREPPGTIESLLNSSEKYLMDSGNQIQLAKTRFEMARLKLSQGDKEKARYLAQEARKGLPGYGDVLCPDDLRHLLEGKQGLDLARKARAGMLEMFVDMAQELDPSSDLNALLARIVEAMTRFLEAERGGVFFLRRGGRIKPVLRAGYNLSATDVSAKEFAWSLDLVSRVHREDRALVLRREGAAASPGQVKAALCVPFMIEGMGQVALYHDNTYMRDSFEHFDLSELGQIAKSLAGYVRHLDRLNHRLQKQTSAKLTHLWEENAKEIVTENALMLEILAQVDQVAPSDGTVLIMGETGVGKELVAHRLHKMSARLDRPFVIVDPTTIPETLVESELFGHEKGAFTGADHQKTGRLELADGGTLFIDEVGEIPKSVQVKLLRAIQEKTFVRLGGTSTVHSDFRLVAATNRDLAEEVAAGRFREDLYYRINVVPFTVPPLRERKEDIPLLAAYFLARYAAHYCKPEITLTKEDEARLKAYDWPGNVRELENMMERTVLLSQGEELDFRFPAEGVNASGSLFSGSPTLDQMQRRYIKHVLEKTGGKVSGPGGAAEILGMKRTTLDKRIRKLGLR